MRLSQLRPLSKTDSLPRLPHLLPVLAGLCLFAGCTIPPRGARAGQPGTAASLKVYVPSPVETATGHEVRCQIQSIDNIAVGSSDSLTPGTHRLIVALTSEGREYVGEVDLIIPEAKNYRLKAEKKDDSFTLSLVEVVTDRAVATSTAPTSQQMKFLVFVLQK